MNELLGLIQEYGENMYAYGSDPESLYGFQYERRAKSLLKQINEQLNLNRCREDFGWKGRKYARN
jgi:hypothetical protein